MTARGKRSQKRKQKTKPDGLDLKRLTSIRLVNDCVAQFHVFSRGCTDAEELLHAFRHYREVVLKALRLRRTEGGDLFEADILLINGSWTLQQSCATHHEYWRFVPELKIPLGEDNRVIEPKVGEGLATYAVWINAEKRSGVVVARDIHKSSAASLWEEVENKTQGGVRYKQIPIGDMYKRTSSNGKPPYRAILSAPITLCREAYSDPVRQPILECIGTLNITYPVALTFTNEDLSWAQGCAALIGSLHGSLYVRLDEIKPDFATNRHPNEVVLLRSRPPEALRPTLGGNGAPARTTTTRWPSDVASYKGKVDAAIVTIIREEFDAVRDRFLPEATISGRREYNLCHVPSARTNRNFLVAVCRQVEPGNGESGKITSDIIEDLAPKAILVVGIAGAVPVGNATLGDVIFATSVADFRLSKAGSDGKFSFDVRGEPVSQGASVLLVNLGMHLPDLVARLSLPKRPPIPFDGETTTGAETARTIRKRLHERYDSPPSIPVWHDGPIGSSDVLVTFSELADQWLTEHRKILAVEMEAAGACQAARQRQGPAYPVVPIRAASDVIGLKRDDEWKLYAARIAAAYAFAFIQSWQDPPT
jgi:nucleoside phosphorylase